MPLLAGSALGPLLPGLIILVLFLGLMSWQTRRTVKKQQAERNQLESSLGEGSRVMLNSGIFGTITHLGDRQAVVELAPGAEVTILKQAIAKTVGPDDEEFAFADEAEDQPLAAQQPQVGGHQADAPAFQPPATSNPATTAEPATGDQAASVEPGRDDPTPNQRG